MLTDIMLHFFISSWFSPMEDFVSNTGFPSTAVRKRGSMELWPLMLLPDLSGIGLTNEMEATYSFCNAIAII